MNMILQYHFLKLQAMALLVFGQKLAALTCFEQLLIL